MLLVVDAGNTHIVLGVFAESRLIATWRMATDSSRTGDEYGLTATQLLQLGGLPPQNVKGVAISCVSPGILPQLQHMSERYFNCKALVVTGSTPTFLKVLYSQPHSLGADRLINSVAAARLYGTPVVVVDLGTATTIDCVSANKEFLGGVIAPGIATSRDALLHAAPGLPRVELSMPVHTIGVNTTECMQAGTVLYAAGAIDALVRSVKAEMQAEPVVVATGGLAKLIQGISTTIQTVNEHLTLQGLCIIYEAQTHTQQ